MFSHGPPLTICVHFTPGPESVLTETRGLFFGQKHAEIVSNDEGTVDNVDLLRWVSNFITIFHRLL